MNEVRSVKHVLTVFDRVWSLRYETDYGPCSKKDVGLASRLLTQYPTLTVDELETWCERYLAADDDFLLQPAHKFSTFIFRLNTYRSTPQIRKTNLDHLASATADFIAGKG